MRVYNFSPGPSMLPEEVLKKAAAQMLDCNGTGTSAMEMSHRSKAFIDIFDRAKASLKELMHIPDDYEILFVQGGATMQFSMVPMNLMTTGRAAYVDSGNFAHNAAIEAGRFGQVDIVASSRADQYTYVPDVDASKLAPDTSYLHITTNNTIFGTRFTRLPKVAVPLVADMSSNILSQVYDVNDFDLIYAGAQKNMGPAGVAVVIIKKELIGKAAESVPVLMNYKTYQDTDSMYNTPPCYSVYVCGLVFDWLLEMGGVPAIYEINVKKAQLLYDFLDQSGKFTPTAQKQFRSLMNVTFVLPNKELDDRFVKEAEAEGFVNLKGHRVVGGMRASIYNAMPVEGVEKLVDFMAKFEKTV
ncbi:MAG: 3-phosphoserine/phosphohydroxythreonine transaminase [Christensenellales bacterium]